jgi:hypothetical protein
MKRILVERGEVTRMTKLFGCSGQAVRDALRGFTDSELGYKYAKKPYGRVV